MKEETYRKYEELVDWLETECQSTETADLSHSFAEGLMIRLAGISYLRNNLQPVTAKPEQETKCNLCKDEHWIITHEGRVSEPCPACGGGKRYVEQEKAKINKMSDNPCLGCNNWNPYGTGYCEAVQLCVGYNAYEPKKEQEKPSESAEDKNLKSILINLEIGTIDKYAAYDLINTLYARQKHPVTDDMISAKLDSVNFETSRERETAFDLLVWLRDLTGRKHMPYVKKFSDRLDQIFEQGNPTKAQIIDAFNKFSGHRHMPTGEEIEAEAERLGEREDSKGVKFIDGNYFEGFVDCAKWMKDKIK